MSGVLAECRIGGIRGARVRPSLASGVRLFLSTGGLRNLDGIALSDCLLRLGAFSGGIGGHIRSVAATRVHIFLKSFRRLGLDSMSEGLSILGDFFN